MKTIYISTSSDRVFKTEAQAFKSGEDFTIGYYCPKCRCTTTTNCECK